ncbi:E3 ubiquitin ligase BIG BROTHER-related-like [Andrographis paniculata]|uniref:E3 ubiquitin ligase BIG BROTHER-related-like n=1 Tax=Andrographis paniculata TaxID=175694 RepID=UPI0021E99498|nr:E3 ubiquitin ligase BIG BROTHER-related-like [Andrographis paniculata]
MEENNDRTPSNDNGQATTDSTLFEHLRGRRWEPYDSDRICYRMVRAILQLQRSIQEDSGNTNLTREDFDEASYFAVEQDIVYLRNSGTDLTPENEDALFYEILGFVETRVSGVIENLIEELNLTVEEYSHQHNDGLSDEAIDGYLKKRNLSGAAAVLDEEVLCIVCRDDFKEEVETKEIARLECGHEYHVDCIKKWLRLNNTCPLCRAICVS